MLGLAPRKKGIAEQRRSSSDSRIHSENINAPILYQLKGSPAEMPGAVPNPFASVFRLSTYKSRFVRDRVHKVESQLAARVRLA